ncbi:MAG TPA: methyltransferase domain-containing protein [Verrucomicrobiae bacterium]|jgi:phosphatidylethanolamine/phosphatidyl-N-methylethanolamine N-methyltransferase|nr:methyltransferase domain-containing protein [Verrucomicrobiae bacterium]
MATLAKKFVTSLTDTALFLQEWLANPQGVGAVAPSSKRLADTMAKWLPSDPESYVLELGPGTGVVTEALFRRGLRQERLVAIEQNSNMSRMLREKFPRAQIINGDAWKLDDLLRRRREPIEKVGAVISSLPLLNFPPAEAERLADKIRAVLDPHGKWVQFTYRIHRLRPRGASSFRLRATKIIWLNLPPARVSVFQK